MRGLDRHDSLPDTPINHTPESHQGANDIAISVVRDGMWHLISHQ